MTGSNRSPRRRGLFALQPAKAFVPAVALLALAGTAAAQHGTGAAAPAGGLPAGHPPVTEESLRLGAADTAAITANVTIALRNGTGGGPGEADELELLAVGRTGMVPLAAARPARGDVALGEQAIVPAALYVVQAARGANRPARVVRGQDLLGGPVELSIYDGTAETAGLRLSNVNLVVRRVADRLEARWLMTLENDAQPPRAIVPDRTSPLALRVPGGLPAVSRMQASAGMMPLQVGPLAGERPDWVGVDRAVQPGRGRLDVIATLPYPDRLDLPLEASVDIEQLTIFAYPPDLKITGPGLTEGSVDPQTGFLVLRAPAIPAGTTLSLTIAGGDPRAAARSPHGGTSDGDAPAGHDQQAPQRPAPGRRAFYLVVPIALLALGIILAVRRNRTLRNGR